MQMTRTWLRRGLRRSWYAAMCMLLVAALLMHPTRVQAAGTVQLALQPGNATFAPNTTQTLRIVMNSSVPAFGITFTMNLTNLTFQSIQATSTTFPQPAFIVPVDNPQVGATKLDMVAACLGNPCPTGQLIIADLIVRTGSAGTAGVSFTGVEARDQNDALITPAPVNSAYIIQANATPTPTPAPTPVPSTPTPAPNPTPVQSPPSGGGSTTPNRTPTPTPRQGGNASTPRPGSSQNATPSPTPSLTTSTFAIPNSSTGQTEFVTADQFNQTVQSAVGDGTAGEKDEDEAASTGSNTALLVGVLAGSGLFVIVLIVALALFLRGRKGGKMNGPRGPMPPMPPRGPMPPAPYGGGGYAPRPYMSPPRQGSPTAQVNNVPHPQYPSPPMSAPYPGMPAPPAGAPYPRPGTPATLPPETVLLPGSRPPNMPPQG